MKKINAKFACVLLSVLMVCVLFSSCAKNSGNPAGTAGDVGSTYPLKGNPKVTYWMPMNSSLLMTDAEMKTTPFAIGLQERTGVTIEYIHPSATQADEQFNIMLASQDLPDIIEWQWYSFPGGPQKAMDDGYILKLNEAIDKYSPNLKKFINDNPDIDRMIKTDNGDYYVYPFVRGDDLLKTYFGPITRADWLRELGIEPPETIDEWEAMLTAYKEKKNVEAPLLFKQLQSAPTLAWAFGTHKGFYMENGKVVYGPMQPEYMAFLERMNKWFSNKLLVMDMGDGAAVQAALLSGRLGTTFDYGGSVGRWLLVGSQQAPGFDLTALKYPVLTKGTKSKFSQQDFDYAATAAPSAAISATSKNVEVAAKLLDYAYGEEGTFYYNYGTEEVTYNMVDGYPTYTDLVFKNPDGLAPVNVLHRYTRASYSGPFIQQKPYIEQYYSLPQQQEALKTWMEAEGNKNMLPLVTYTSSESGKVANIMNEINTYVDTMTMKFIMGVEPISEFDNFVNQIKKMKIEEILQIQEDAVKRYNNR